VKAAGTLAPIKYSVAKGTATYQTTAGPPLAKLQAVAVEALNGAALVVALGAAIATGGAAAPALSALNLALTALKTGVTLARAYQANQALKKAAKEAQRLAMLEAARLNAEETALLNELTRLRTSKAKGWLTPGKAALIAAGAFGVAALAGGRS
jgi:hypothetical protein